LNGIENKIKYLTELDHMISLKNMLDATRKLKNHKASRLRFRGVHTTTAKVESLIAAHCEVYSILYNYSLLLRSMRVFMDLKNDIHQSL
jgi:hypothetical protein